jgi:hypothetical protein
MQSKNKPSMSRAERAHVGRIKEMPCAVCDKRPNEAEPTEAHEPEQGLWFLAIPLCADCHRGWFNGIHGQGRIWKVLKKTEMSCLNETLRALGVS